MINIIDRDTILCISLAAKPSHHGVRFHNWLYDRLGLNYVYKAVAPHDIHAAVAGIRGLGIRGAGVSMPYKQDVIALLDELDPSARRIHAVNTIVNTDGVLKGYNTDYLAVRELAQEKKLDPQASIAVLGSGGMAYAVVAALSDYGFTGGTVVARNERTGSELAQRYQWNYSREVPPQTQILVNVTPLGMYGDYEDVQAFSDTAISSAEVVFDVVAYPVDTPLIQAAQAQSKIVITGGEVVALQAARQFTLYTGVELTSEDIAAAEHYAQQV
ncbi:shikimate 5-dehydrogenase [Corynebacterium sp. sy017]|uniref:shikimate 5-dehydrogenase n=1 Tax=unclassified Corynebacterium TaxID=2624378 RepID=UPI00118717E5|nr:MULTISPECIES: shikimate 5-dehydrogenase [unclassified Corynebacterium]MBP3088976.1 shikimate 5-dehydrogenase [Corynebacterium sp. sy017]TSD91299.1 shikimate 5-dehydrogenase [Corynebacterium sp. SY003]